MLCLSRFWCADEHVLQAGPVTAAGTESRGHRHREEAPPTHHVPHPSPRGAAQIHLPRVLRNTHELPLELYTAGEQS